MIDFIPLALATLGMVALATALILVISRNFEANARAELMKMERDILKVNLNKIKEIADQHSARPDTLTASVSISLVGLLLDELELEKRHEI